jgi:hypothetical protein
MSEPSQNLTVKLELDISVGSERKLRAQIQLEGHADIVSRASRAVTSALTSVINLPVMPAALPELVSVPAAGTVTPGPKIAPVPVPVPVATPQPAFVPPASYNVPAVATPTRQPENSHRQYGVTAILAQRDWSKFSLSFGVLLILAALAVAVIFPPLVPREQRLEVFMMSLAFGLLGTLALYAGALPGRGVPHPTPVTQSDPRPQQTMAAHRLPRSQTNPQTLAMQRATFLRAQVAQPAGTSLWGMAFGVVFVLAGVIAPFALGTGNADERFLMMLGFAPVAAVGVLLIAIFWRRMQKTPQRASPVAPVATATAPRSIRSPVSRVPNDVAFKVGVPAALATLGILLLLVIGLVVVATLVPLLR